MEYVSVFSRLLIGGLFLVSALAKLRDPAAFRNDLRGYRLVARRAEAPMTTVVIAAEVLVAVLMIFESTALLGLLFAAGMLAGFAAAMGSVLRRGLVTGCGCLGRQNAVLRPAHVWRNLVLIAVCLAGATTLSTTDQVEPAFVFVLSVAAGCVVATLVFFDDLLTLFSEFPERNRP